MRLTEKQIKDCMRKYRLKEDERGEDGYFLVSVGRQTVYDLLDTIEAQQQEIGGLKDDLNAFTHKDFCRAYAGTSTTIGDLQQQIQQLQAENGAMREALDEILHPIKYMQIAAEKYGNTLDGGIAIMLGDNASYLKGIAEKALAVLKAGDT